VLLDSVILIDHFNGVAAATAYLARTDGRAAVSVISRAEVLVGFTEADELPALRLLDYYPTLAIDAPTADAAARLRRQHGWKLPDALQAALAQRHGLRLATRNTRDFPPERYDFVVMPYSLKGEE
jgi:predicted nucleic acid-binding protein